MEFISAEEFLKQEGKVQKVLREHFNGTPCLYNDMFGKAHYSEQLDTKYFEPLLIEGQLRQFVKDKTGYKIDTTNIVAFDMYKIELCELDKNTGRKHIAKTYNFNEETLLQAYWKVAIQIAKES